MKIGKITNHTGLAIIEILTLIGVSVYFIEWVTTIADYSNRTYQEVKLENLQTQTPKEPFLLTDFYYRDINFKSLNGKHSKSMVLYLNSNDSVAKVGIEISKKHMFQKEVEESGKIRVELGGALWRLPTYQGTKLFGYQYMSDEEIESFKQQLGEDIMGNGVMLKHIPTETLSDNWMKITLLLIVIIANVILIVHQFSSKG